jgi:hypothetical protein
LFSEKEYEVPAESRPFRFCVLTGEKALSYPEKKLNISDLIN